MWDSTLLYLTVGGVAGFAAGLFGIGGGIVIVPFLAWILPRQGVPESLVMVCAVATSLATIVVTSVSAVRAHHRKGAVQWPVILSLSPGIVLGSMAGPTIAAHLPVPLFKSAFAVFLWWVAAQTLAGTGAGEARRSHGHANRLVPGVLIGLTSSVLGIGGGTLSVPYLLSQGLQMKNAIAVAGACGFPIAVTGTLTFMVLGWGSVGVPQPSLGYVLLPAFSAITLASVPAATLGARLAHRLPTHALRRAFAFVLMGVGARLFWQGAWPTLLAWLQAVPSLSR